MRPAHPNTGTACSSGPGGSWSPGQQKTGHMSIRGGTGADTRSPGQEVIRSSHYQMSAASPCTHRLQSRRSPGPRPGGYNRTWREDTCTSRTWGGTSRKLDQEHFLAWLTWCLRDTWSPRPPRHSHSRGHTPGTRSWSGHQGGWRHTPDTGHISDGLSGWCHTLTFRSQQGL